MFVIPNEVLGGRIIDGVFGQAESCIIPGLVGFEVGLSAFGDAYAWLRRTLAYPTVEILAKSEKVDPATRQALVDGDFRVLDYRTKNEKTSLKQRFKEVFRYFVPFYLDSWSGKRDSNSRPQPWQGCALPTELFPHCRFRSGSATCFPDCECKDRAKFFTVQIFWRKFLIFFKKNFRSIG